MIQLEPHPQGVILPVRAQPGASKSGVRGQQGGMLKVAVTQIAEKGKANQALREVLCMQLRLRRSQVELLSGEASASKRWLVREISIEELSRRIEAVLSPHSGA
jgi:uncharacterized protein (TIGR00251 family)